MKWRRRSIGYSRVRSISIMLVVLLIMSFLFFLHDTSKSSTLIPPKDKETLSHSVTDGIKKSLEFVHITKTGGSAIENAGSSATPPIIWGACHYMSIEEVGCATPDIPYIAPDFQSYALTSPWHTPPKILRKVVDDSLYPYADADLFAVIRNPYDRIISEYYCPWQGFQAKYKKLSKRDKDPNDPVNLNYWVKDMITRLQQSFSEFDVTKVQKVQRKGFNEDPYNLSQKHYINQAEYVYDGKNVVIKNVIHYENLSEEFDSLMKKYSLNVKLPSKEEAGVYTENETSKRLTYRDLSPESIEIINQYARPDFDLFGYTMVDKFEEGDNYSLEADPAKARFSLLSAMQ
jgi:hypothetical protein